MWGDFLLKRIKHELKFIGENIPVILLGAFVCCIGGILLWVSGGSGWYYVYASRGRPIPSLALMFLVWFVIYGLCGIVMSLACLYDRTSLAESCPGKMMGMKAAFLGGAGYLMMLSWYAVFFCTRLILFSSALLILSFICYGAILFILKKRFLLLTIALILIETVQLGFICFNFSFCLLK